jgi:hypothetical protein
MATSRGESQVKTVEDEVVEKFPAGELDGTERDWHSAAGWQNWSRDGSKVVSSSSSRYAESGGSVEPTIRRSSYHSAHQSSTMVHQHIGMLSSRECVDPSLQCEGFLSSSSFPTTQNNPLILVKIQIIPLLQQPVNTQGRQLTFTIQVAATRRSRHRRDQLSTVFRQLHVLPLRDVSNRAENALPDLEPPRGRVDGDA